MVKFPIDIIKTYGKIICRGEQMENPLFELFQSSNDKAYRIADSIGMPRNTIYRYTGKRLPSRFEAMTVERIAAHFGQRVVISLEPIEEAGNGN